MDPNKMGDNFSKEIFEQELINIYNNEGHLE
jgi:hypothetical protein